MVTRKINNQDQRESSEKRLDCIIRLIAEALKVMDNKAFNDGSISRILYSAGLSPKEIAQVLGKKNHTAISQYLYKKK